LRIPQQGISALDRPWTELLRAAERGDERLTHELALRLAHEVLASPAIQLAHEVLAGGAHATAKAIELAEALAKGETLPGGASPSLTLPEAVGDDEEREP
jgi:hypothetical protein